METLQGFETILFGSVITVLLSVISFFLIRNLNRLETTQERHSREIETLASGYKVHEVRIDSIEDSTKEGKRAFEAIMTKLGAMSGD